MCQCLALGQPVLVPWCEDSRKPRTKWTEAGLRREFCDLRHPVIWQDALLRAKERTESKESLPNVSPDVDQSDLETDGYWFSDYTPVGKKSRRATQLHSNNQSTEMLESESYLQGTKVHHSGPVGDCVDTLQHPEICANLLDSGSEERNRPFFIHMLCDHSHDFINTERINVIDGSSKKPIVTLAPPDSYNHNFHPMNKWKLMTGAGYVTFPHHDSGGLATYIMIKTGMKIWGIFRPKEDPSQPVESRSSTQHRLAVTEKILN
ncbi:hypothetical protein SERLADRAFT_469064, partial [Serpula lacrymans var. lacrymans S7.9]